MSGPLPSLLPNFRSDDNGATFASLGRPKSLTKSAFNTALLARVSVPQTKLSKRELYEREERKTRLKRNLIGRPNGTIDPFYECFLLFELIDYAVNFTAPWCTQRLIGINGTLAHDDFPSHWRKLYHGRARFRRLQYTGCVGSRGPTRWKRVSER